jgi:glycosyltransferase involved in cell wall biosynthesis
MSEGIERTVVHYALNDPRTTRGGVESFAQNLGLVFREVLFMTPNSRDLALVRERRLPVICDNQWVLDWPSDVPVIGFQHGVVLEKLFALRKRELVGLARRQARAAKRPNTLWVACARWISDTFARLHGNRAAHVIYHPVDVERFDGRLDNAGSRLVLHDGRFPHKGSLVYPRLARAFPDYRFEPLACTPAEVPERLRRARAFLHLSSYEGNSIVCNEAMAMNLPCLFTRVGLARDGEALDIECIPRGYVYGPFSPFRSGRLLAAVGEFLQSAETRGFAPRRWVETNASLSATRARWAEALASFDALGWG